MPYRAVAKIIPIAPRRIHGFLLGFATVAFSSLPGQARTGTSEATRCCCWASWLWPAPQAYLKPQKKQTPSSSVDAFLGCFGLQNPVRQSSLDCSSPMHDHVNRLEADNRSLVSECSRTSHWDLTGLRGKDLKDRWELEPAVLCSHGSYAIRMLCSVATPRPAN